MASSVYILVCDTQIAVSGGQILSQPYGTPLTFNEIL